MSFATPTPKSSFLAPASAALALETAQRAAAQDGLPADIEATRRWEAPLIVAWQSALGQRDELAMASAWQAALRPDYFGQDNLLFAAQQAIAGALHDQPRVAAERAVSFTLKCLAWARLRQGIHNGPSCKQWARARLKARLSWAFAGHPRPLSHQ